MNYSQSYNLVTKITFRGCKRGDVYSKTLNTCQPCERGTYSLVDDVNEMKQCLPCNDDRFFCYGGDKIAAKEGFWRIGSSSDNFVICP